MSSHAVRLTSFLLFLAVARNAAGQSGSSGEEERKRLVAQEVLRDTSPGSVLPRAGDVELVSDEEGTKAIGRIGIKSGDFYLGVEASSKVQEGAGGTELLNLDGLSSGATAAGVLTWRGFFQRDTKANGKDTFQSVCQEFNRLVRCNLVLDRIGDPSGGDRTLEMCSSKRVLDGVPLLNDCSMGALSSVGYPWDERVDSVRVKARSMACEELSKITGQPTLAPEVLADAQKHWPFPQSGVCSREGVKEAAATALQTWEDKNRQNRASALDEAARLGEQARELEIEASSLPAQPSEAKLSQARDLRAKAEKKRADAKALEVPKLLSAPEAWLASKEEELLQPVCVEYRNPPRDLFIETLGNAQECDFDRVASEAAKLPRKHRARIEMLLVRRSDWVPVLLTARYTTTRQSFSFVETSDLDAPVDVSKRARGLGVSLATLYKGTSFLVGYEDRKDFKAGKPSSVCRPLTGTDALVCSNLVLSAPSESTSEIWRMEVRRFWSDAMGVTLRTLYRPDPEDYEVHSIFHFLRHKTRGLDGGVDISWDSMSDDVKARVFVGSSFRLFEQK